MPDPILVDVMERASNWPQRDQAKLVAAARLIEAQQKAAVDLTDEDWLVIDRRVEAAGRGGLATDMEVAAFFGKYAKT
jgi:hypothetical protein